ncbi:hypothetical protein Dsin_029293 [Dipteronia sinensis]|uniref:Uncharacterized protein n=1 Tax=Dipteronia sinensis TaxID=43782 RepID=A0AAE0DWC8_9ROSI|nr:hypothetical protein Dsin_029293 [Dipteronia sinensis]
MTSTSLYKMFDQKAELEFEKELEKGNFFFYMLMNQGRKLNSRLHSAGHLMDAGMQNVGLGHLERATAIFSMMGTAPQSKLQSKAKELELEANAMISGGGKVSVAVLPYEEASKLCDGVLPDCIPKRSTPRIVKLGTILDALVVVPMFLTCQRS